MDPQRSLPLLVALLTVLLVTQTPRLASGPAAPTNDPSAQLDPTAEARALLTTEILEQLKQAPEEPVKAGWAEPLRLYREFLGLPAEKRPGSEPDLEAVRIALGLQEKKSPDSPKKPAAATASKARPATIQLKSIVALVPDPIDSNLAAKFDQAVEAIQIAGADTGYLLDRLWLPWTGDAAKAHLFRDAPGMLLFRGSADSPDRASHLLAVYLVGETPKQGVHPRAFAAAMGLAARLTTPVETRPCLTVPCAIRSAGAVPANPPRPFVRILGPSFSGSAPSLYRALRTWRTLDSAGLKATLAPAPELSLRVVTGTATAKGLDSLLPGVCFQRTVMPDNELQRQAFTFLIDRLGWEPDNIALLTESDTAYGQEPSEDGRQFLLVPFPIGLSSLRSAWEKDEEAVREAQSKAPVAVPRNSLGLSLTDQSQPVDIAPQFSTLSAAEHDLALSNLLASLWRGGVRYLGILSTDARDKLYLAERIRRFAPDLVLFTFDNDLLYAHPQHSTALDGTLVLSSFPLYTETEGWRKLFEPAPAGTPVGKYRRQLTSELQQGIFLATKKLLGNPIQPPRGWIAVVGSGSLWPVASFPDPSPSVGYESLGGRGDLQLLLIAAALCLLALWLRAVYPQSEMLEGTGKPDLTARRLLAFGSTVLAVLGGSMALIGTLPFWASGHWMLRSTQGADRFFEALYLTALAAMYVFLVWNAARSTVPPGARNEATHRRARQVLGAWVVAGVLLLPALALLIDRWWMPGGAEFFYPRARKLTNGLSPLVSLLLLGGALFCWVLIELKRRRLIARQAIEWPLRWRLEPPLEGVLAIAEPVYDRLHRTFPSPFGQCLRGRQGRWFWISLGVVLLPPAVMLLRTVQPIAESRQYGRLFLLLALLAFCLAAVSFYQFFALWLDLDRLLHRLDHTRLAQAFRRISEAVAWSPMRAFGWHPPSYTMLVLSAERLRLLVGPVWREELRKNLDALFLADQQGNLADGLQARGELSRIFSAASQELADESGRSEVEEFFALRLVAFLRPVVAHMRNCLSAALLTLLVLLFAVRSYAFEPKWFISMGIWVAITLGVAVTLWVFVQMDRNASLSAIGNTPPGKVSFDRHFYFNVLTYGVIPLAGIAVTQFPEIGRFISGWLNPVLQVTGKG